MKIAFQIDPIDKLNYKMDSSLAMARVAQQKGVETFFFYPSELAYLEGRVIAQLRKLEINSPDLSDYKAGEAIITDMSSMDVIFIRQDPPVDMNYITNTYILEYLQTQGVRVVNDPKGLRNCSEKMIMLKFGHYLPPSLVTNNFAYLEEWFKETGPIVIKNLYDAAGRSIMKVDKEEELRQAYDIMMQDNVPIMAQKFLPHISGGDIRIFVINGKVIGGFRKIPAAGKFTANILAGGKAEPYQLTAAQEEIATKLASYLKEQNILLAGIDMIDEYVFEINVTSPTGFLIYEQLYSVNLAEIAIDEILSQK